MSNISLFAAVLRIKTDLKLIKLISFKRNFREKKSFICETFSSIQANTFHYKKKSN